MSIYRSVPRTRSKNITSLQGRNRKEKAKKRKRRKRSRMEGPLSCMRMVDCRSLNHNTIRDEGDDLCIYSND
ncbi:hypothetical protein I7I50_09551 [Histoplasma capsulatum G186AR]|uniref:Uncharacterized protein n=1 Tax=Ajellomyces capsulatus TaxID=5037 RepID=A0A8H7YQ41_AJECA|nr:hypothetical protein I7I52_07072 [Histoplasma capsulatum]QSS74408.1 hypothetical protein I7I50_09551 [Histoplasma capsulatum G186AR]